MKIRATLIDLWQKSNPFKTSEKIFWNGEQNMYPSEIERVVSNSPTGARAFQMFSKFIFGKGISEQENITLINGKYLSEVAKDVVDDVALQNGAFIHVKFGIEIEGDNFKIIPVLPKSLNYENCRISKPDDESNEGMILVGDFKDARAKKKWFYPFSTDQEVIKAQINRDASEAKIISDDWSEKIKYYRGQVLYLNLTPKYRYAHSKFDSAFLDLDTEFRILTYINGFSRGGFLGKTAVLTVGIEEEVEGKMMEDIQNWLGSEGAQGVYHLDIAQAEDIDKIMKIIQVPSQFDYKQFELVIQQLKINILGSANNLPQGLAFVNDGAMFDSGGDKYRELKQFYWEQCDWERQKIEEVFYKMGFNFTFESLIEDVKIQQDDTIN